MWKQNPVDVSLLSELVPGFAAYAGTRLLSRFAMVQVGNRWPRLAPHAGVIAAGGSFLAAWLLGNRIVAAEKYHASITVGAGVAALQTLVRAIAPQYSWIVSDVDMAAYAAPTGLPVMTPVNMPPAAAGDEYGDGGDDGFTDEETEQPAQAAPAGQPQPPEAEPAEDDFDDIGVGGVFAGGGE
jgi:hypothetical protein